MPPRRRSMGRRFAAPRRFTISEFFPSLQSAVEAQAALSRMLTGEAVWHVEVTGIGTRAIRDAAGLNPLAVPDPVERAFAIELQASAPTLRQAVLALVRRFESLHDGWHRDEQLVWLAWEAIRISKPSEAVLAAARESRSMGGELPFEDAA